MSSDRRRYFRVQDSILVKYRVLQNDMIETERREIELNRTRVESARAALFGIETDFQELCGGLKADHPSVVDALQLMNRKLNLIERVLSTEVIQSPTADHVEHELQSVNISGGGMAVTASNPLTIGANLLIDLILLPTHDPIRTFGSVVGCREVDRGDHEIAIEYTDIRPEDREKLIQFVMRRQSAQLREQRDAVQPRYATP